jgi:hypothetical protein
MQQHVCTIGSSTCCRRSSSEVPASQVARRAAASLSNAPWVCEVAARDLATWSLRESRRPFRACKLEDRTSDLQAS